MLSRFCTYCGEILEGGVCEVCLGNSTPSSRSADPRNSGQIRNDVLDEVINELAGMALITSLEPQKRTWQAAYNLVEKMKT